MANLTGQRIDFLFVLRDYASAPITGKVDTDFATLEAYVVDDPTTTAVVSLGEIGSGEYHASFIPTIPNGGDALTWAIHLIYNSGGVLREFVENFEIASSEWDPFGQPSSGYPPGTVGYELHALFKRPTVSEG